MLYSRHRLSVFNTFITMVSTNDILQCLQECDFKDFSNIFMSFGWDVQWCPVSGKKTLSTQWISKSRLVRATKGTSKFPN